MVLLECVVREGVAQMPSLQQVVVEVIGQLPQLFLLDLLLTQRKHSGRLPF